MDISELVRACTTDSLIAMGLLAIAYLEESVALLESIRDVRSGQGRQILNQVRQMRQQR
jgi:hypothetical protein